MRNFVRCDNCGRAFVIRSADERRCPECGCGPWTLEDDDGSTIPYRKAKVNERDSETSREVDDDQC